MLSLDELAELYRSLRNAPALSVYLDMAAEDPGGPTAWVGPLKRALHSAREAVDAKSPAELAAFDAAAAAVLAHGAPHDKGALGAPGWVAFASGGAVRHAEAVRVRVPTMVAWGQGIRMAPYLRVQATHVSALTVIVDHPSARIFRYVDGSLTPVAQLHAHTHIEPVIHMGNAARQGFHPGTRGTTGTDELTDELRVGFDRMVHELVDHIVRARRTGDWIVVGGTPQPAVQALRAIERGIESHPARGLGAPARTVVQAPTLHDVATDAEIGRATELAVSELQMAAAEASITELIENAGPHGRSVLGLDATRAALADRRVRQLLLAEEFIDAEPIEADAAIGTAFDQAARVDAITGPAAIRLVASGGIGALLRYTS
jgi:hypothetical protein